MNMRQCMGGFCGQRDSCGHYVAGERIGVLPAERLCERGRDVPSPIKVAPRLAWPAATLRRFPGLQPGARAAA